MFDGGHGSWPEHYDAIVSAGNDAGFAVIESVHVDPMHYPDREKFTNGARFGELLSNLPAASICGARNLTEPMHEAELTEVDKALRSCIIMFVPGFITKSRYAG